MFDVIQQNLPFFYNNQERVYLFAGLDFSWASFSSPILSFNPSFRSGIPERKHFIRIFPVTSHLRTLPTGMTHLCTQGTSINTIGKDNCAVQNQVRPQSTFRRHKKVYTLNYVQENLKKEKITPLVQLVDEQKCKEWDQIRREVHIYSLSTSFFLYTSPSLLQPTAPVT